MKRVLLVLILLTALPLKAASFGNGDFSASGSLWNDASATGSVSFSAGQAVLETGIGTDAFSAVMVQGDDGNFSFISPISLAADINWLLFDAKFDVLGTDNTETGNGFSDALSVSLYDSLDFNLDLLLDPVINSSLDGMGFISYALNVAALQGRDIALSFEFADEDDGFDSRVTLDNVSFAVSVPEPSVLVLFLAGLPLIKRFKKIK